MVGEIRIRLPFLSNALGTEESARHMSNQISVVPLWLRGATFLLHAKKRNFPSFSFLPPPRPPTAWQIRTPFTDAHTHLTFPYSDRRRRRDNFSLSGGGKKSPVSITCNES